MLCCTVIMITLKMSKNVRLCTSIQILLTCFGGTKERFDHDSVEAEALAADAAENDEDNSEDRD